MSSSAGGHADLPQPREAQRRGYQGIQTTTQEQDPLLRFGPNFPADVNLSSLGLRDEELGMIENMIDELYDVIAAIGSGAHGKAILAVPKNDKRIPVVLKLPNGFHWRQFRKNRMLLNEEAKRLELIHHPRVVRFRKFIDVPETAYSFLEMEFAAGGSLAAKLEHPPLFGPRLSAAEVARIIYDVLQALAHIHSLGIMHLDVK